MPRNRIVGSIGSQRFFGDGEACAFPRPSRAAELPAGFVPCPMVAAHAGGWPQWVYWMAMQQAREVVRPSWTERALTAGPN